MRPITRFAWLLLAALVGCAHQVRPDVDLRLKPAADHPLVGRIFAAAKGGFVPESELLAALSRADFVVLGETHDDAEHHRLQGALLDHYLAEHPGAHVGFEMLDEDSALGDGKFASADELAKRVKWEASGWPAFALYRPVFEAALRGHAQLLAANPSRAHVMQRMQGISADERAALHISPPLPAAVESAQREEIVASHCGHAPEQLIGMMQRAQNYKDAFMANRLVQAGAPAALIAGHGHARRDRGVPLFVDRLGARMLSIALREVDPEHPEPSDYEAADYDYTIFTPPITSEDPCQKYRKSLEKMEQQASALFVDGQIDDTVAD